MLDINISDFDKRSAKRMKEEQLIEQLDESVQEASYHRKQIESLSSSFLTRNESRENFEIKAIVVKEIARWRRRSVELYNLFPQKEKKVFLRFLLDLREAELALILLELKRNRNKKFNVLQSKQKKEHAELMKKLEMLWSKAEEDIKEILGLMRAMED